MKYRLKGLGKLLLMLVLFSISPHASPVAAQTPQQPKPQGKAVFTNEDFPASTPKASNTEGQGNESSTSNSTGEGGQIRGLDLQFRILDLKLQSAQQPDDKGLREDIIRLNSQLKDAPLSAVTSADLRDLKFRERYIDLKISLVKAELEAQQASSGIQAERRKVLKGRRGRKGLAAVRDAQRDAEQEQDEVEVIKAQLDALLEEGRQAGAGPRAFR